MLRSLLKDNAALRYVVLVTYKLPSVTHENAQDSPVSSNGYGHPLAYKSLKQLEPWNEHVSRRSKLRCVPS